MDVQSHSLLGLVGSSFSQHSVSGLPDLSSARCVYLSRKDRPRGVNEVSAALPQGPAARRLTGARVMGHRTPP